MLAAREPRQARSTSRSRSPVISATARSAPVPGAHVTVTGTYTAPIMGGTNATLFAETTTDEDGLARLTAARRRDVVCELPGQRHSAGELRARRSSTAWRSRSTRSPASGSRAGSSCAATSSTRAASRSAACRSPRSRPCGSRGRRRHDLAAFIAEIPAPTAVTDHDRGLRDLCRPLGQSVPRHAVGPLRPRARRARGVAIASWTLHDIEIPARSGPADARHPRRDAPGYVLPPRPDRRPQSPPGQRRRAADLLRSRPIRRLCSRGPVPARRTAWCRPSSPGTRPPGTTAP